MVCESGLQATQKAGEKTPLPLVFSYHPLVTSLNIVPADRRENSQENPTPPSWRGKKKSGAGDDESIARYHYGDYCKSYRSISVSIKYAQDTSVQENKVGKILHWILFGQN